MVVVGGASEEFLIRLKGDLTTALGRLVKPTVIGWRVEDGVEPLRRALASTIPPTSN